jgi:hypothetical protein
MLNPFTFYFFNSTLGYFTCSEFEVNKYQSWICFTQLVIGIGIFFLVIWLDERAFRNNFKAEDPQSLIGNLSQASLSEIVISEGKGVVIDAKNLFKNYKSGSGK